MAWHPLEKLKQHMRSGYGGGRPVKEVKKEFIDADDSTPASNVKPKGKGKKNRVAWVEIKRQKSIHKYWYGPQKPVCRNHGFCTIYNFPNLASIYILSM